jgi:hypothetical protein
MIKRALCRSAELTTKPDESGNYKNPERDRALFDFAQDRPKQTQMSKSKHPNPNVKLKTVWPFGL